MRSRLRRMKAHGREFVWRAQILHVKGEGDCHRCVRVRIWGEGKNSRVLEADLLSRAWGLPWGCATDDAHPEPRHIRQIIDYALSRGWDPRLTGGAFLLSEREHSLELDDFLLTDRLRDPGAPDPTARVIRAAADAVPDTERSENS